MAVTERDDLDAELRRESADEWAKFGPEASTRVRLQRLPRAWTVADMALTALNDVNLIDPAVIVGRMVCTDALGEAQFLFPVSEELLRALACTAAAYAARFEYRLDFGDLEETIFLIDQVHTLAREMKVDVSTVAIAAMAIARAKAWRFQVLGDPASIHDATNHLEELAFTQDPYLLGRLAECLRLRASVQPVDEAVRGLERASVIATYLLNPESPLPRLKVQPWLEVAWGTTWALAQLGLYRLHGESRHLKEAMRLAKVARYHVSPTAAEAAAAYLEVGLAAMDNSGQTASALEQDAARMANDAIEAGKGRYWFVLTSALSFAEWSVVRGLGTTGANAGRVAYDILDQTIAHQSGEDYRRRWLPWLARATALAVPALARAGYPDAAVSRLEQARTRILQERFVDDISETAELARSGSEELAGRLSQALTTLRAITASRNTRALARDNLLRITAEVRELPGRASFRSRLSRAELASLAAPFALVYLAPGEGHGVALLGGGTLGEWRSIDLPACTRDPLPVRRFLDAVLSADSLPGARRRAVSAVTEWLWNAVWEPISRSLSGLDHVWLVPCSYLALLPIHAARQAQADWQYALEQLDIRYAVSLRTLARAAGLPKPAHTLRFVGIPEPPEAHALEGALSEVGQAAAYFSDAHCLSPAELNETLAMHALSQAGYLHAACHGIADAADPLQSGLAMGPKERLTLRDLFSIRTGLELGVLSACETNVPDRVLPDEATSLAAGLHLAGCRAVIASSWRVPDPATAALMRAFYANWRGPAQMPPSRALRAAQLDLAHGEGSKWSEPYFWAGFSFLGAAEPTDNS